MKPIKHTPYSKTSYLPAKLTYGKFSPTDELLHIIELHQKEMNRLQLIIAHQSKVVAAFEKENERLQGIVNGQIRARFGRSTEQSEVILDPTDQSSSSIDLPKNKRGAKVGHKGQGRKIPDLPEREVFHEIPHDDRCCKDCGLALQPTALTEDSYTLDIEVRYVRVKHRRERAVRTYV